MFAIFVYVFMASVSLWLGKHFHSAYKKHANANYREFFFFFSFLGVGLLLYPISLLASQSIRGVVIETGNFLLLLSFAFVFRAFLRFQQISFLSPVVVLIIFTASAAVKFIIGVTMPATPVIQDSLIYWHYSLFHSVYFGTFIAVFTVSMAFTLLANITNVAKNKKTLLFLGLAFLAGGIGGVLVHSFNVFLPLAAGYLMLLACAIFMLVFILGSRKKET